MGFFFFLQTGTLTRLWEVDPQMLFATLRGYCKMSSTYSAGLVRLVSLIGGLPGFGDVALAPVGPTAADLLQTLEIAVVLSRTTGLKHAGMPFNFETWLVSTIASTGPAFATVRRCADVCCCCLSSSNRDISVWLPASCS